MFKFSNTRVLSVVSQRGLGGILDTLLQEIGVAGHYPAGSADEAFELIAKHQIDIALIDDNPPALDGIAFTLEVRLGEDSPNPYLPLILMSRAHSIKHTIEAYEAGVHDVMAQPFPMRRLKTHIARCLVQPPKFICSDHYFGPDRKSMKNGVLGNRRRQFEEQAAVQEQVDRMTMAAEV